LADLVARAIAASERVRVREMDELVAEGLLIEVSDAAHSWEPIDLLAVGAEPPEPPTIGGIAYPGRRHVWSGEPEALKTWLVLCVAAEEIRSGRGVLLID